VSTPQPPKRRRIAGESKPGAPAPRTSPIKKVAKKQPAKPSAREAKPAAPPPPARPSTATTRTVDTEPTERRRGFDLSRFRMSGRLGALVALTVAALAFGGWFGYQGWNDWRGGDVTTAHEEAASSAASSVETIFSYQYDKLDEHLEDSKATMTKSFAKKFQTISPALNDLAPQRKIQVKSSTREAAPIECGNSCDVEKANILVFIDQARVADGAKEPTVFGNRIRVEMVKQDGAWLVNNIVAL
jgi:hypothetical protein